MNVFDWCVSLNSFVCRRYIKCLRTVISCGHLLNYMAWVLYLFLLTAHCRSGTRLCLPSAGKVLTVNGECTPTVAIWHWKWKLKVTHLIPGLITTTAMDFSLNTKCTCRVKLTFLNQIKNNRKETQTKTDFSHVFPDITVIQEQGIDARADSVVIRFM